MDDRMRELHQMECASDSQLADKDREIQSLIQQVEFATRSSVSEVTETRVRIEESMKEMEAHKAKRLAARNEMIGLAKSLERAQADGEEIKSTVQYGLTPIVYEQIAMLEALVTNIEMVAFHMTSKDRHTALTAPVGPSTNPMNGSSGTSRTGRQGSVDMMEPGGKASHRSSSNINSISDALVQVESLRLDLDRVMMGLTLMTLSVEKLVDIVTAPPPSLCGGIFDVLLLGATGAPPGAMVPSVGSYTTSREGGSDAARRSPANGRNSGAKKIGSQALDALFNAKKKKQGYHNISASSHSVTDSPAHGHSGFFSIEGSRDDMDDSMD